MAILYKISAATGKYTDKDGNEKNRYVDMGVVMETKNGPMLKLEAVPVGWDGWAYLNEPKAKEEGEQAQRSRPQRQAQKSSADDFTDSEIPF
jgi:hypothetical protein